MLIATAYSKGSDMEVVLQGKRYSVTRESVERVRDEPPGTAQRYVVRFGNVDYPLKQAASAGLAVPPVAFTSQQAYRWLAKLGFEVIDLKDRVARPR